MKEQRLAGKLNTFILTMEKFGVELDELRLLDQKVTSIETWKKIPLTFDLNRDKMRNCLSEQNHHQHLTK